MTKSILRRACACLALTAGMLGSSAVWAQADPDPGDDAGTISTREIVVTGTLIRGTPEDAALPVDVFSSDDIAE